MKLAGRIFGLAGGLIAAGCCAASAISFPEWYSYPLGIVGLGVLVGATYVSWKTHKA